jgi:hypothetical protein
MLSSLLSSCSRHQKAGEQKEEIVRVRERERARASEEGIGEKLGEGG